MKQAFITIFAAALLVVGCHPENTPVSGITLTPPYVEITCGDTVHLKATATPEDASYTLEWSSSDNSVATVDEYGVITAVAAGKTVITATASGKSATCSVTVSPSTATEIILSDNEITIRKNETHQLVADVLPEEAVDKTITWSSSDPYAATVDESGLITGVAAGEAVITASIEDVQAECKVTVSGIDAESASIEPSSAELKVGETLNLTLNVLPEDADYTCSWSSSNESAATVDQNGTVTATSVGETTITADVQGIKATCTITVAAITANIGDWYYSDGTWSTELDPDKTPIGLVFWTGNPTSDDPALKRDHPDCTHGLVVALNGDEAYQLQPACNDFGMMIDDWQAESGLGLMSIKTGTGMEDNLNKAVGYNNTLVLEAFNNAPANSAWPVETMIRLAEYRTSVPAPQTSSDWYIPSVKELSLLCTGEYDENINDMTFDHYGEQFVDNRDFINTIMNALPEAQKLQAADYNSSSEMSVEQIFLLQFEDGNVAYGYKNWGENNRNRFILAF